MAEAPGVSFNIKDSVIKLATFAITGLCTYGLYCLYNYNQLSRLDVLNNSSKRDETAGFSVKSSDELSKELRVRIINLDGPFFRAFNHPNPQIICRAYTYHFLRRVCGKATKFDQAI
jgi:hypothetical protein